MRLVCDFFLRKEVGMISGYSSGCTRSPLEPLSCFNPCLLLKNLVFMAGRGRSSSSRTSSREAFDSFLIGFRSVVNRFC